MPGLILHLKELYYNLHIAMQIALVNTNRIKPFIAPIGLDYLAEMLNAKGHAVKIIDLCFEDDWKNAINRVFSLQSFDLVGFTLRNTDDCAFSSRQSFMGEIAEIVSEVRTLTDSPLVMGGVGFSIMPEESLEICRADLGIWGDGEFSFSELVERLDRGEKWQDIPGLIRHENSIDIKQRGSSFVPDGNNKKERYPTRQRWHRNVRHNFSLSELPLMSRSFIDNRRYFAEGGQGGFETKRGCSKHCVYCPEPQAKGKQERVKPPHAVAYELECLLDQGIDHLHTCDSEFNIPYRHAVEVCNELINRRLGEKLRWYAYCAPVPFSKELALLMRKAGCVGINFGVDSGDEGMLERLKREHRPADILTTVKYCRDEGIIVMLDLLLGSPGETEESLTTTIRLMKESKAERIGVSTGVRVYPGTPLYKLVQSGKLRRGLVGNNEDVKDYNNGNIPAKPHSISPIKPLFFLEPAVADSIYTILERLIGGDSRFLFFDPSRPQSNYNYNANDLLVEAIRQGYRGAYWDILRRYSP